MSYPTILFAAMIGAAVLGFFFAWAIQHLKIKALLEENRELIAELNDHKSIHNRLKSELDFHKESRYNLQGLLQDVENQALKSEADLKTLQAEHARLQEEYRRLGENPVEKVREIEVIREVPVLVFRESKKVEDRREKAKQLVKAFRKGYTLDGEATAPPTL